MAKISRKKMLFPLVLLFIVKLHPVSASGETFVPPQPSQYSAQVLFNGRLTMYYADTTLYRDRVEYLNPNSVAIIDFQNYRQYVISTDKTCSWSQIPGRIKPLLSFATYDYNGTVTINGTLYNKWTGCHNYEIPPAPFEYYATFRDSIPFDLILPTIGIRFQFSNFTFAPPRPTTFDIPRNCTEASQNLLWSRSSSHRASHTHTVGIFC